MGSDAKIYLFDYAGYLAEVVPMAKHLLLSGDIASWWAQAMHDEAVRYGVEGYDEELLATLAACRGIDLDRHCTYLGADLQLRSSLPDLYREMRMSGQVYTWAQRACRSPACPLRSLCPFHADVPQSAVQAFNDVLHTAVVARCLGPGQFVGRSQSAPRFQLFLEHLGIGVTDPLHTLLRRLGYRGFVVGYGFANGDGLHGWLTPEETTDLRNRLAALPLPQYEASFATMDDEFRLFHERHPYSPGAPARSPDEEEDIEWQWRALSLSFIRTVATVATASGQGVLWGNDLREIYTSPDASA